MARLYPYHFHKFGSNRKTTISQKCEIAIKKNKISPNPRHINTWLPVGADAHNPHICRTIQKECPTNTPHPHDQIAWYFAKLRKTPERLVELFLESRSHSNWSATTYIRTQLPPSQWTKAKYLEYLPKISPDHIWNLLPTTTEISSEECVKFPHRGQNKPFVSKRTNPHNSIFCFSFISIKSNVNKIRIKTY